MRDIIVKDIETKHPYIPGQSIHWFNPGTPERDNWLSARNKFFTAIFPNKDHRRSFIESIVDSALEAELPTSLWGILTQSLKIFASARKTEKRKRVWEKTIDTIIELIFTMQNDIDEEFIFSYNQVSKIWASYDSQDLTLNDFFKLHSVIDTKLRAGVIKDEILKYPELDKYVSYKLRFFNEVIIRYKSF